MNDKYKDRIENLIKKQEQELDRLNKELTSTIEYNNIVMGDVGSYDVEGALEEENLRKNIEEQKAQIEKYRNIKEEVEKIETRISNQNKIIRRNKKYKENTVNDKVRQSYNTLIDALEEEKDELTKELESLITDDLREKLNENMKLSEEDRELVKDLINEQNDKEEYTQLAQRVDTAIETKDDQNLINNIISDKVQGLNNEIKKVNSKSNDEDKSLISINNEIKKYKNLQEKFQKYSDNKDTNVTDNKELEQINKEIEKSLNNFYKIFDAERKEKNSSAHSFEDFDKIKEKYNNIKEQENKNLQDLKKKKALLEEKLSKNNIQTKESPKTVESIKARPLKITKDQKQNIDNNKKILNTKSTLQILADLKTDLQLKYKKDNKKYLGSTIEVFKNFKDELHSGNYAYNIVKVTGATVGLVGNTINKIRSKITTTEEDKKRYEELKTRVNSLSENDFLQVINEYKGNNALGLRQPIILNTMLLERYNNYVIEQVNKINQEIIDIHDNIYKDLKEIRTIDNTLKSEKLTDSEKIALITNRQKYISGKANQIKKLREKQIDGNNLLSGKGLHAFSEEMKAMSSKMNIVGKRFAKDFDDDQELSKAEAELDQEIIDAIENKDDEKAFEKFVAFEQLEMSNTKIANSIFGKRSIGKRYFDPLLKPLDYRNDPFIKDLLTTVAVVGSTVAIVNQFKSVAHNKSVIDAHNQELNNANAHNQDAITNVNDTAKSIVGTKGTIKKGIKAEGYSNTLNASNVAERAGLDKADWNIGSEAYYAADAKVHNLIEKLETGINKDWSKIEAAKNAATSQDFMNIASKYNNTFVETINEALPIAKAYAKAHPNIELGGVLKSMTYLSNHPHAITNMESAAINNIELAQSLQGLSIEKISAIEGLDTNLGATLLQAGAVGAMLARSYQGGKKLETKYGKKYGNIITDMIEDSIDNDQVKEEFNKKEPIIVEKKEIVTKEDLYNEIIRLNPNGEFKYNKELTMDSDGSIIKPDTLISDLSVKNLVLPDGFYYDDNNITNKHNAESSIYITLPVKKKKEEYDIDPMFKDYIEDDKKRRSR